MGLPADGGEPCDFCRAPLDSWCDENEPATITKSIESLQETQDKVALSLYNLCLTMEAQAEE